MKNKAKKLLAYSSLALGVLAVGDGFRVAIDSDVRRGNLISKTNIEAIKRLDELQDFLLHARPEHSRYNVSWKAYERAGKEYDSLLRKGILNDKNKYQSSMKDLDKDFTLKFTPRLCLALLSLGYGGLVLVAKKRINNFLYDYCFYHENSKNQIPLNSVTLNNNTCYLNQ